jgi:hypothetical protein
VRDAARERDHDEHDEQLHAAHPGTAIAGVLSAPGVVHALRAPWRIEPRPGRHGDRDVVARIFHRPPSMRVWLIVAVFAGCGMDAAFETAESECGPEALDNGHVFRNASGASATWSSAGYVALDGDFFAELGTNGRHCGHCHAPDQGWTVAVDDIRRRFQRSKGLEPLFRTNDATTSPGADVSTLEARREAYGMLLSRGVFRIAIPVPANAEFEVIAIDDPYGNASTTELTVFRRPLPAANLGFIGQVMWDGRVTAGTITGALAVQANGASQGHAERPDPIAPEVADAIVAFELGLYNAQVRSREAGRLDAGARGGPEALSRQTPVAGRFDLFDAWADDGRAARRAVYRGQELFNTRPRPDGRGPCLGCHSMQNVGTNANGRMFDVGVAARRAPDQPLYTLRRIATGEVVTTTDPGRALITGLWSDVSRFKTPSLRALAARAPYFHDGSAGTLAEVVRIYEEALGFDFTADEEADLVAFLVAL